MRTAGARTSVQAPEGVERVENQFTEIFNDKEFQSNIVWTRTPDMTPSIHIEKYDVASGEQAGDRDDVRTR